MKKRLCSVALFLLLSAFSSLGAAPSAEEQATERSKLRFAATQHEVISILIGERQFDRVMVEFGKILALDLENKTPVVQEAWIVASQLVEAGNTSLAYSIIDKALDSVTDRDHCFTLLMLKGKVLKQEGRMEEALSIYRQAQSLQR